MGGKESSKLHWHEAQVSEMCKSGLDVYRIRYSNKISPSRLMIRVFKGIKVKVCSKFPVLVVVSVFF